MEKAATVSHKTMTTKYSLLIILNTLISITASSNTCIDNAQNFIRATDIHMHDFETLEFDVVAGQVDLFLRKCQFVHMDSLRMQPLCEKACSLHASCAAYTYDEENGCELCATERQYEDDYTFEHENIFIGLRLFENHIFGNVFQVYF